MKTKSTFAAIMVSSALGIISSQAATIILDNTAGGLGALLDGLESVDTGTSAATIAVPGFSGLKITFLSLATTGTGTGQAGLNSTANSLGINSPGTTSDSTELFDSALSESASFSFNQDVEISSLDFTNFSAGEEFRFAGQLIENSDLSNGTTDTFDFGTTLKITAGTSFTLEATSGSVGIEGIELTSVPEPSAALLGAFGALGLVRRRR